MSFPRVRVADLCDVLIGRTPRRDTPAYWAGENPWVTVRELNDRLVTTTREGITDLAVETVMPAPVQPGTLLFSFKLSIGKMGFAGVPLHTNEAIAALPIKDEQKVLPEYLRLALKAVVGTVEANHAVLGMVLNKARVGAIEVPLPPLEEQHRIVDLLSRAAGLKRMAEEAQAKARELIPALFVDMFGDPTANPQGWPMTTLGDLGVRFIGGKNLQAGSEEGSQYRILKISAVTTGVFNGTEAKPAPPGYQAPLDHVVRDGDLLFSRANTVELVGATAQVSKPPPNLLLPDKLWRIVVPEGCDTSKEFLFRTLQQPTIRTALSRMATGTSDSMRNISKGRLRTLPILCPPKGLQTKFADRVTEIASIQRLAQAAADAADVTSAALMSRLFVA